MHLLPHESILLVAKPSPKVSAVWLITRALALASYATAIVFLGWTLFNVPPERGQPSPYGSGTAAAVHIAVFVVALGLSYLYMVALARTYEYTITNQRFLFSGGILRRVRHAVEHRRVTDVQLSQNLIEQLLPLYSISLFTPGTASVRPNSRNQPMPELRLEGLTNGEEVFTLVSNCVNEARRGGATHLPPASSTTSMNADFQQAGRDDTGEA